MSFGRFPRLLVAAGLAAAVSATALAQVSYAGENDSQATDSASSTEGHFGGDGRPHSREPWGLIAGSRPQSDPDCRI